MLKALCTMFHIVAQKCMRTSTILGGAGGPTASTTRTLSYIALADTSEIASGTDSASTTERNFMAEIDFCIAVLREAQPPCGVAVQLQEQRVECAVQVRPLLTYGVHVDWKNRTGRMVQ